VVVENRPGAGGDIGTEGVLKAEPDGHTLVMGSIQLTLKPALYKTLRFDPRKDATSIARLAAQPMIIVSRPDFPASTLPELIEIVKSGPGKYTFGTPGPGTPQHFGAEMLCAQAGLKLIHVPYRGAVPDDRHHGEPDRSLLCDRDQRRRSYEGGKNETARRDN
jgi:tripartite-type tricarboxylate transporter receptor subunit TctC